MHIALINRRYWAKGAIPLIQRSLAKWLTRKDVKITVFSSDVDKKGSDDKTKFIKVFTLKIKPFDVSGFIFAFFLFFKLISVHKRERIDILQVHDSTAFYGAYLFAKIFRVPITVFVHGWIYNPVRQKAYKKSVTFIYKLNARFCARGADLIWAVSQEIASGMRSLGAKEEKVKLFLNSIDLEEFKPQEVKPPLKEEKIVLFVGRFGKEKGLEYLIRAVPEIVRQIPEAKFNIIGDGVERNYFLNLSEQLGISDKVYFKGEVPNDLLPKYYSGGDILVIPSLSEGHALVPLEALACGTPVIGSRIDGIVETVVDNHNGLLIEPKDSNAIAQAVTNILVDENLLKRLSANARNSVEGFSWANRINELIEICEDLIVSRRK